MSLLHRIQRQAVRRLAKHPCNNVSSEPLVSFSFDDFPVSAAEDGGAILEQRGIRATYYVCMGLLGQASPSGPLASLANVHMVRRLGHEIASHTYAHPDVRGLSATELRDDLGRNRRALVAAVDTDGSSSFAYPFGRLNIRAKRIIRSDFPCARSAFPGINGRTFDRALLRANPLYSSIDAKVAVDLIRANAAAVGWLIFFTHDIADAPSQYGCTARYLDTIVRAASDHATILPVGEAFRRASGVDPASEGRDKPGG